MNRRSNAKKAMRKLLKLLVQGYQYSVGLMIPPACRYLPSCSEYALEALQQHGALQGSYLSFKRLCRCHPFTKGGIDEVPKKNSYGL
jgi:uncharacterized protein